MLVDIPNILVIIPTTRTRRKTRRSRTSTPVASLLSRDIAPFVRCPKTRYVMIELALRWATTELYEQPNAECRESGRVVRALCLPVLPNPLPGLAPLEIEFVGCFLSRLSTGDDVFAAKTPVTLPQCYVQAGVLQDVGVGQRPCNCHGGALSLRCCGPNSHVAPGLCESNVGGRLVGQRLLQFSGLGSEEGNRKVVLRSRSRSSAERDDFRHRGQSPV